MSFCGFTFLCYELKKLQDVGDFDFFPFGRIYYSVFIISCAGIK